MLQPKDLDYGKIKPNSEYYNRRNNNSTNSNSNSNNNIWLLKVEAYK